VISARSDVSTVPAHEVLPEIPAAYVGDYLQLWPHRHGTDAMFAAYLRRR
jgi:16S rRNA (cytosine967-C5)-methyltransferase